MKKILLVSFVLFINTHLFSQENNIRNETLDFVSSVLFIQELNPSEKEESKLTNKIFNLSLEQYLKKRYCEHLIDSAFLILYRNGSSDYSDSPDERRMKSRRALCFASIALASKPEKRLTFTEYSQFALMGNKPNTELLEERFLGLLFLEILIKYDDKILSKNDLLKVQKYIDLQSDNLSSIVKEKSNKLIKGYTSSL